MCFGWRFFGRLLLRLFGWGRWDRRLRNRGFFLRIPWCLLWVPGGFFRLIFVKCRIFDRHLGLKALFRCQIFLLYYIYFMKKKQLKWVRFLDFLPLLMADSRVSGLEVEARTKTLLGSLSRELRSSETTLFSISLLALSLEPAIASISSMKMIEGAFWMAVLKSFLMFFSDSPLIPSMISVAALKKKGI